MDGVLVQFDEPLRAPDGRAFVARARAAQSASGLWDCWLEFEPLGDDRVVRSSTMAAQPTRNAAIAWARALDSLTLSAALVAERAPADRAWAPPRPAVAPPPDAGRPAPRPAPDVSPRAAGIVLALVILIGAAARLYGIGSQLWLDEIAAMPSMRRPIGEIMTQWPATASHVLYDIAAHLSIITFGETPVALRLAAVVFGIAAVGMLYLLVRRLFSRTLALFITALFALSYHHIFYSQDARGYTGEIFFFLVLCYLFVGFWKTRQVSTAGGIAYALAGAAASYTVLFGAFLVPAQLGVVLVRYVVGAPRRRRGLRLVGSTEPPPDFPIRRFASCALLSILLTMLLYAPFIPSLTGFTRRYAEIGRAGVGPSQDHTGRVVTLVLELVKGLSAAFHGPLGLALALIVAGVGIVVWYRRHPVSLEALAAPLLLEAVVLVPLGIGINPRFFAVALPLLYIAAGCGLYTLVTAAAERLPVGPATRQAAVWVVLVGAVLGSTLPLRRYYRMPKQDNIGAIRTVRALAPPDAVKGAVFYADRTVNGYYHAGFADIESLADLQRAERSGRPVWLVTTLERYLPVHDPALYRHIMDDYERVADLPASVYDADMRVYRLRQPR